MSVADGENRRTTCPIHNIQGSALSLIMFNIYTNDQQIHGWTRIQNTKVKEATRNHLLRNLSNSKHLWCVHVELLGWRSGWFWGVDSVPIVFHLVPRNLCRGVQEGHIRFYMWRMCRIGLDFWYMDLGLSHSPLLIKRLITRLRRAVIYISWYAQLNFMWVTN